MKVYLDNAATTPLDKNVIEEMVSIMRNHDGLRIPIPIL